LSADPVFVLCNGRSGSTLLRFLLDAHPDLACPPETNLPALCAQLATVWSLIEGAPLSANRGDEPLSPSLAPHACVANIPVTTYSSYGYMQFWWKHSGASTCVGTVERIFTQTQFNGRVRLRIWKAIVYCSRQSTMRMGIRETMSSAGHFLTESWEYVRLFIIPFIHDGRWPYAITRDNRGLMRSILPGTAEAGIGFWSLLKRAMANFAAADQDSLVRIIKCKLNKIQYRPHLIEGCLAGTA
jgi:hypothetical protein